MLRTSLSAALSLLLLTSSQTALANPIPELVRTPSGKLALRRATAAPPAQLALPGLLPITTFSAPPIAETKVLETNVELTLDPNTGVTQGKLTVTLEAVNAAVGQLYIYVDEGLTVSSAEAGGVAVPYYDQNYSPLRVYAFSFSPALSPGEKRVLNVEYGGTLKCSGSSGFGNSFCALGEPMGLLMEGSALPMIIDQSGLGGYNAWGAKRSLTFSLPSGTGLVASGDQVLDEDDGTTHTTRWETPGYHTAGPHMAIFGQISGALSSGTTPPTTVHALANAAESQTRMAGWMPNILAFLDEQAGAPLPFGKLNVIHLPPDWVLPGTASHGLVLLSENYGQHSLSYFEETLAHETSHEWWGILIQPTDGMRTRWLTEGMATLSQVDYAAIHMSGGLSRDDYLTRRYNEHAQILRYLADPNLPPLIVGVDEEPPEDDIQTTIWAYLRSSATLDHLRVLVGESAFAAGLRAYVSSCAQKYCDTTDFRAVLEQESGLDLAGVFEHWVYSAPYPRPVWSFEQTTNAQGSVDLAITAEGIEHELPLQLIIGFADGSEEQRLVTLQPAQALTLQVAQQVRFVTPHPRHNAVVWSRPAQSGDVSFDQEVDGVDVIRCAHSVGRTAGPQTSGGEGIWRHDLDFNTHCDTDGDGTVSDGDLAAQLDAFATLRTEVK